MDSYTLWWNTNGYDKEQRNWYLLGTDHLDDRKNVVLIILDHSSYPLLDCWSVDKPSTFAGCFTLGNDWEKASVNVRNNIFKDKPNDFDEFKRWGCNYWMVLFWDCVQTWALTCLSVESRTGFVEECRNVQFQFVFSNSLEMWLVWLEKWHTVVCFCFTGSCWHIKDVQACGVIMRQLKGKPKKETSKDKKERKQAMQEARQQVATIVLPTLAVVVLLIVVFVYVATRPGAIE